MLVIDADMALYDSCTPVEKVVDWGDGLWTRYADLNEAIHLFDTWIRNVKIDTSESEVILCHSDQKTNWRHAVLPSYKHNRSGMKPTVFHALRNYSRDNYACVEYGTLEADDVCGVLSQAVGAVLVSRDKDFRTIPGWHYNPDRPSMKVWEVTKQEAHDYHMYQTIIGDSVDGYSGIPGIGPVKARKWIEKEGTSWDSVVALYKKSGLTEEDALVQARVSHILRPETYNIDTGEMTLWNP
jgi:DNA polymerase I